MPECFAAGRGAASSTVPRLVDQNVAAPQRAPKARQRAATDAALRELARIGKRLDELTRLARAGQHTAVVERLAAVVLEHWARVRQLVHDSQRSEAAMIAEPVGAAQSGDSES